MHTAESFVSDGAVPTLPRRPYPGLRAFTLDEDAIFFGREPMIDEIIDLLVQRCLILVHGSSGSGKSSLILAGVLPRLARQHRRHGWRWRTASMRPGGGPLWNLARTLAELERETPSAARIDELRLSFDQTGADLTGIVTHLAGMEQERLCLLVDQFEEIFRYARETSREESRLFVDLITTVLKQDSASPVRVILTMRSEFLGECARLPGLAAVVNTAQYLLPRMETASLQRAIRRPADLYGGSVTIELADRLIADVQGSQDELPLIQHGLMRLWDLVGEAASHKQTPRRLDLPLYEMHGPLPRLLDRHAEAVAAVAAPDDSSRPIVENLFRALTDINADGQAIRRPQAVKSLIAVTGVGPGRLMSILDVFRRDGVSFVTPYFPADLRSETMIDISHEALIRCWNSLAATPDGWLHREFRDGLSWRSLLSQAEIFEKDQRKVLEPLTTDDREAWLKDRTPAWSERYGGGWNRVERLMAASRAAANRRFRRDRRKRVFLALQVFLIAGLLGWLFQSFIIDETNWLFVMRPYSVAHIAPYIMRSEVERALQPGASFQECDKGCPVMIVIPAGKFTMGSPSTERNRYTSEGPQHEVTIPKPFAVSKFEVTFADWEACVLVRGCPKNGTARDPNSSMNVLPGDGKKPVTYVSWEDAQTYAGWFSRMTGKTYRLLSEAEWEYTARAGTKTAYYWGDQIESNRANCKGCGSQWDFKSPAEVGQFEPNAFGLYDMAGNVWEWVQDCVHEDYNGAPSDGSVWTLGDCDLRVIRGGSYSAGPQFLRAANRGDTNSPLTRSKNMGFRIGRTLAP
jgi:formylglycine-generating enzyme required for sulfatase activity